ncbi:hypothetical protein DQ04_09411010 [Trypanosoma grayi]|uniref:hypothetical protein n=1 Tax=Trypanosoma grayi TaxID=71804 RepID=UPI0004F4176A|nr:hypothetical protein DQ04_09411010 [Trypanosoma grayi]KEG07567.1 hypothetical protein DQ04_09411010 [Trypanosoma grayi]
MTSHGIGPTTDVTVNVTGTFTLPLHLQALESLEDPVLQEEIMKEATRLALAERLGGFDKIDITTKHRYGKPVCEARLDLADLYCGIANVQHAYEHAMTHILQLQEVVGTAAQKTGEEAPVASSVLAEVAALLQRAAEHPGEAPLVAAIRAAACADKQSSAHAASGEDDGDSTAVSSDGYRDPTADGYAPLLDCNDAEVDEMDGEEEEENREDMEAPLNDAH